MFLYCSCSAVYSKSDKIFLKAEKTVKVERLKAMVPYYPVFVIKTGGDTLYGEKGKHTHSKLNGKDYIIIDRQKFEDNTLSAFQTNSGFAIKSPNYKPQYFDDTWMYYLRRGKITILHGKIFQYSVSETTTTVDKNPNYAGPVTSSTNYTNLSFKYVLFYEAEGKNYEKLTNSRLRNLIHDNPNAVKTFDELGLRKTEDSFLDVPKVLQVIDIYNS